MQAFNLPEDKSVKIQSDGRRYRQVDLNGEGHYNMGKKPSEKLNHNK